VIEEWWLMECSSRGSGANRLMRLLVVVVDRLVPAVVVVVV
jgi:hypothetical protein